jgi:hypothetical protein
MSSTLLYRIAAVVLILFALGHTVGFLTFNPPSAEGLSVREAMNHVQFQVGGGAASSYGRFYRGFGLIISVYFLFLAFLAWRMGALASTVPSAIGGIAWALVLVQLATLILSWLYFSAPPVILSAILTVCLAWAASVIPRGRAQRVAFSKLADRLAPILGPDGAEPPQRGTGPDDLR